MAKYTVILYMCSLTTMENCKFIGGGSILNVWGPRCKMICAQNFKPCLLISGNASMKMKKQRWTIGKKTVDFKESSNETSMFLTLN